MKVSGDRRPAEIGALLVLTAVFGLLSTGIIRNWRWTFWLILVALWPASCARRFLHYDSLGQCRLKPQSGS